MTASAQSAARPVLVELFTSEGCSSCPPADALLRELEGKRVGGGLVVALSEHVTYWNQLGWRDPFSLEAWTARQGAYGQRFGLDSVYTPQVVVDGQRQVLGSDGQAVRAAVGQAARVAGTGEVRIARATAAADGQAVLVEFTAKGVPPGSQWFAVVADDRDESHVGRGENAGRELTHVAVARSLEVLGGVHEGANAVRVQMTVAGAGARGSGRHVVVFAQEQGSGRVGAVGSAAITAGTVDRAAVVR